eukprot:CAMPEP_0177697914 /NCGR_PEP_ID=MMETSP0484_2-20121128/4765_1 /TAXON_ID=354590 /ORGANISM="Rhodomonas lens, Strain RHODO" /LENGTH=646 /DNA_ID=CAMNT_0019208979 /DNA_START=55 /DNA_END=1995 /DNA_ORIENTATION=+
MSKPEMVRWCGSRGACDIDNESGTVKSFHNSTVALPSCLVPYGKKAYFEMEVVSRGKTIQAGWATLALERSGHDEHSMVGMHYGSWGVDGVGQMTHGDGKEGPYDCGWTEGDVVGLAVDLVGNGAIYFSLNGKWDEPNGVLFSGDLYGIEKGVFPVCSCCEGSKVVFNFGASPFKFSAPDASFKPVHDFKGHDWETPWNDYNQTKNFGLINMEVPTRQQESGGAVIQRWIGSANSCALDLDSHVLSTYKYATIAVPTCTVPFGSKGYYEIEILQCVDFGVAGWAGPGLEQASEDAHYGLGDVPASWGITGTGEDPEYPCRWKKGDVIGMAVDLAGAKQSIHISVNGSFSAPNGQALQDMFDTDLGLFPAASVCAGSKCVFNFGERAFKFTPPDASFEAVLKFKGTDWEASVAKFNDRKAKAVDRVERAQQQQGGAVVRRWIGGVGSCSVDQDSGAVATYELATVAVPGCLVPAGAKAYYEVEVLYDKGIVFAGYATEGLARRGEAEAEEDDLYVGSAPGSWGVNGAMDPAKWGDGEAGEYPCQWAKRDIVGLAVDLSGKGSLHVTVNGKADAPNGLMFSELPGADKGVFPACSLFPGFLCRFNFGETPFKFAPPTADFKPVVSFKDKEREAAAQAADDARAAVETA